MSKFLLMLRIHLKAVQSPWTDGQIASVSKNRCSISLHRGIVAIIVDIVVIWTIRRIGHFRWGIAIGSLFDGSHTWNGRGIRLFCLNINTIEFRAVLIDSPIDDSSPTWFGHHPSDLIAISSLLLIVSKGSSNQIIRFRHHKINYWLPPKENLCWDFEPSKGRC